MPLVKCCYYYFTLSGFNGFCFPKRYNNIIPSGFKSLKGWYYYIKQELGKDPKTLKG